MGAPKAWLSLDGEPLLVRTARVAAAVAGPVVVVAAPEQELPSLPASVTVLRDPVAGLGPLQGLVVGLERALGSAEAAYVLATDLPHLHAPLLRRLAELRRADADAVVPRVAGRLHPLCALYGPRALAVATRRLAARELRLTALLAELVVVDATELALLAGEELGRHDPALSALANANTPEDWRRVTASPREPS